MVAALRHPPGEAWCSCCTANAQPGAAPPRPTFEEIVRAVVAETGVPRKALMGTGRVKSVAAARSLVCYLARAHTLLSFPEIGALLGGRHHTTIISAEQRIAGRVATDSRWRTLVVRIEGELLSAAAARRRTEAERAAELRAVFKALVREAWSWSPRSEGGGRGDGGDTL